MKHKLFGLCLVLAFFFSYLPVLPQTHAAEAEQAGYIYQVGMNALEFKEVVLARMYNSAGEQKDYTFAERVRLVSETDSQSYRSARELYNALRQYNNTCCRFVLNEEGDISQIWCSTAATQYESVTYHAETRTFDCDAATEGLPVYLRNGDAVSDLSVYLRNGYICTIQVSPYGVIVTDFKSPSFPYTLTNIDVKSPYYLVSNLRQIAGELTFSHAASADNQEVYLCLMLYNADGWLMHGWETRAFSTNEYIFAYDGIDNAQAAYQVRGYLIDDTDTPVSETFTVDVSVERVEIVEAYIGRVELDSLAFDDVVQAHMYNTAGEKKNYTFAEQVQLAGETGSKRYQDASCLYNDLRQYENTCCRFVLNETGAISQIQCSAAATQYETVGYDTQTGTFDCDAATEGLPVYFMGNDGVPAESGNLSESYLYTITVSPYGVRVIRYEEKESQTAMPFEGTITACRYADGAITATICMNRCAVQGRVLLVLYDARGAVVNVAVTSVLPNASEFTVSLPASAESVNCMVKVFFLSPQNGLLPLGAAVRSLVQSY